MKFEADKEADMAKLRKAFIKVLNNVKDANKSSSNPFTKSTYPNLTDVNNAAEKAVEEAGFGLSADVVSNGDTGFVSVTNHLISEFGQIDFETLSIPTAKKDAQGYGSAITYARRYALNTNLNISVEDDDGNAASYNNGNRNQNYNGRTNNQYNNYHNQNSQKQPPKQAPQEVVDYLRSLIDKYSEMEEKSNVELIKAITGKGHVNRIEECPEALIYQYIKILEQKINDAEEQPKEGAK